MLLSRRGYRRSAVPMLLIRRKPDHIAWRNFLDQATPTLSPSKARRDDQRVTEWMSMPAVRAPGSNVTPAPRTRAGSGASNRVNASCAGKPISRPVVRALRSDTFYFHSFLSALNSQLTTLKCSVAGESKREDVAPVVLQGRLTARPKLAPWKLLCAKREAARLRLMVEG